MDVDQSFKDVLFVIIQSKSYMFGDRSLCFISTVTGTNVKKYSSVIPLAGIMETQHCLSISLVNLM